MVTPSRIRLTDGSSQASPFGASRPGLNHLSHFSRYSGTGKICSALPSDGLQLNSVRRNYPSRWCKGSEIVERPLRDLTQEARFDARVNPYVEWTEQLWQESLSAVQETKRAVATFTDAEGKEHVRGRDFGVVAPLINAAARSLELFGKGAGHLADQPSPVQQNTIVVVMQAAPAMADEADAVTMDVT